MRSSNEPAVSAQSPGRTFGWASIAWLCAGLLAQPAAAQTTGPPAAAPANAAYVAKQIVDAYGALCRARSGSPVCGGSDTFSPDRPGDLAQLAPDKFVMQGVAGLLSTQQQFQVVRERLSDLHGIKLGLLGGSTQMLTLASTSAPPAAPAADAASPGAAAPTSGAAAASSQTASGALPASQFGLYFHVDGAANRRDPNAFDAGFRERNVGVSVGGDYKLTDNAIIGATLSATSNRSTLTTADAAPNGNSQTRGAAVSVYGAYFPAPAAYLDATLNFGRNSYDSVRSIPAVPNDSAQGSTSGRQYGLSVGAGYSWLSSHWTYGPYAQVSLAHVKIDGFTEAPNTSGTNLAVAEQSIQSLESVLGAQVSYASSQSWGIVVPSARLEWVHQFKDDKTRTLLANFAAAPGSPIVLDTSRPDRNYLKLGVGTAAHFGPGRSAFVQYKAVLGRSGYSGHAVSAEVRLEF